MAYFILIGAAITLILIIAFIIFRQGRNQNNTGLSWKLSILNGIQIYMISLFLGSFVTVVFGHVYENKIAGISFKLISETFGLFMYSIVFTFFIVLPVLIIGLKLISKNSKNSTQKEIIFGFICLALVLLVNMIMGGYFKSVELVVFLSGFSILGVVTPWLYVKYKKVFARDIV